MPDLNASLPSALASQTRTVRLGPSGVPALVAHPDWSRPAPLVVWMHGRTATKELDPGRYLRWIRAGIAACALDLPGHGERLDPQRQSPGETLGVMLQMLRELDGAVEALLSGPDAACFDRTRLGIGGMSLGGMVTLRRLCRAHPYACAAVECTTGSIAEFFRTRVGQPDGPEIDAADPAAHLDGWRPIPLLVLHNALDRVVPVGTQRRFVAALKQHYIAHAADARLVEMVEFPENGSPDEHAGFGRLGNEAKNTQLAFLNRVLVREG